MTFKELYEISSEIHFDLFDEVDGSLGCLSTGPIVDDGLFEMVEDATVRKLVCVSSHMPRAPSRHGGPVERRHMGILSHLLPAKRTEPR